MSSRYCHLLCAVARIRNIRTGNIFKKSFESLLCRNSEISFYVFLHMNVLHSIMPINWSFENIWHALTCWSLWCIPGLVTPRLLSCSDRSSRGADPQCIMWIVFLLNANVNFKHFLNRYFNFNTIHVLNSKLHF